METIRQLALRRFFLLGLSLVAGLSVGVYEFLKGELPAVGFGVVLLLLMIAFLTGISLILRAASRQIRRHFGESISQTHSLPGLNAVPTPTVLELLRGKSR